MFYRLFTQAANEGKQMPSAMGSINNFLPLHNEGVFRSNRKDDLEKNVQSGKDGKDIYSIGGEGICCSVKMDYIWPLS